MKKINLFAAGAILFYAVMFMAVFLASRGQTVYEDRKYMVEINRMMRGMEEAGAFSMPDLSGHSSAGQDGGIEAVSFLPAGEIGDVTKLSEFFQSRNGCSAHMEPLIIEESLKGMVRFDYGIRADGKGLRLLTEGVVFLSALFCLTILVYVKYAILSPFHRLSGLPYELAKGHLGVEIPENKDRFFGKFAWGLSMLRDELKAAAKRNLELEKEKKMLILSISHDIKTPLNSIRLYAKALRENLYEPGEKRTAAVLQIENLSKEIEAFVKEIVRASSGEIVPVEVEDTEFYLKDLAEMIRSYYGHRCRLLMTKLVIGEYENKLIRGDKDRAFEAVENIMENALKYGDGKEIAVSFYEEQDCQIVRIKNTGQPVKQEEITKLFDSFFRGSNAGAREGNGLGLYICRDIMRRMGGEIFADAETGGMSFHLVFPVVSGRQSGGGMSKYGMPKLS